MKRKNLLVLTSVFVFLFALATAVYAYNRPCPVCETYSNYYVQDSQIDTWDAEKHFTRTGFHYHCSICGHNFDSGYEDTNIEYHHIIDVDIVTAEHKSGGYDLYTHTTKKCTGCGYRQYTTATVPCHGGSSCCSLSPFSVNGEETE